MLQCGGSNSWESLHPGDGNKSKNPIDPHTCRAGEEIWEKETINHNHNQKDFQSAADKGLVEIPVSASANAKV